MKYILKKCCLRPKVYLVKCGNTDYLLCKSCDFEVRADVHSVSGSNSSFLAYKWNEEVMGVVIPEGFEWEEEE